MINDIVIYQVTISILTNLPNSNKDKTSSEWITSYTENYFYNLNTDFSLDFEIH